MNSHVHTVRLTDEQLAAVSGLFCTRGWELEVQTDQRVLDAQAVAQEVQTNQRFLDMQAVADDYVELKMDDLDITGRASPQARTPEDVIMTPPGLPPRSASSDSSSQNDKRTPDRAQSSFKEMKSAGLRYKSLRSTSNGGSTDKMVQKRECSQRKSQGQWRLSKWNPGSDAEEPVSDINFRHFCIADDNTIKIITKLSTEHVHTVSSVPVRIVILVDRSGSMLQKIGLHSRHSKITKVRHFVRQLISSLDNADQAALVTFGDQSEVLFPMKPLTKEVRSWMLEKLQRLDQGNMSRETNLSDGIRMALKVFFDASSGPSDYFEQKNSILIFTDGDVNAGTTGTNALIHEVRQNIRQMSPTADDSVSQWVTISVISTGQSVSEQAYMLSKTCSSESFYYIDKASEDSEAEFFIPVLLRKSAVAWNISYVIEAFHGLKFIDDKCSRDNRVRMRRSVSGKGSHAEKAYYLYDFPAGHSRQLGVCADRKSSLEMDHLNGDEVLFKLRVEYTNITGERYWQEHSITKDNVIAKSLNYYDTDAQAEVCLHDLKIVSGDVLHSAAEHIKAGDKSQCKAAMQNGQRDLQALLDGYGERSKEQSSDGDNVSANLMKYAQCVADNMVALIGTIEKSSVGESWNKIKAVSTAIVRESPNASDAVLDGDVLCPLPEVTYSDMKGLQGPLERLAEKRQY